MRSTRMLALGASLLVLFGASPAVCSSFVAGRAHELQTLREHTLYLPHGTSLRMGRLGYQSDAQSSLAVSYNFNNFKFDPKMRAGEGVEQEGAGGAGGAACTA